MAVDPTKVWEEYHEPLNQVGSSPLKPLRRQSSAERQIRLFNKLRGQFAVDAQLAKEREANALAKEEHISVQPEDTEERSEQTKEAKNIDSKDIELDIYEFIDLCLKCPEDQHQFIYLRQKDPDDFYDLCTVPFRNIDSNLY